MLGESKNRPAKTQGRRKEERSSPQGCLRSRPYSPEPCSGRASSPPPVSREAIQSYSKGGPQDISRYICSSHFSETQHRGSQGKAWRQGGGAQKGQVGPLQAVPSAGLEQLPVGCGAGWSGDLLSHREACGVLRAAGRCVGWGGGKRGRLSSAGGVPGHHGCCGQGKGWGVRSKPRAPAVLAPRAGVGAECLAEGAMESA